jgi:predicted RNase H-like HicB family nuclease
MKFLAILENEGDAWGAYVPDLPGCVSAGSSREEAEQLIREAIAFHIEGMREDGAPVPMPSAKDAVLVDVPEPSAAASTHQHGR